MSFQISLSPSKRAAGRFVGKVRRSLQKALSERPDISRAEIARELDVHRSVITRQLSGTKDISLSRAAEIACLLGYDIDFDLVRQSSKEVVGNGNQWPVKSNFTSNVVASNARFENFNSYQKVLVR